MVRGLSLTGVPPVIDTPHSSTNLVGLPVGSENDAGTVRTDFVVEHVAVGDERGR